MTRKLAGAALAAILIGLLAAPASHAAASLTMDADVTPHGRFFIGGWFDDYAKGSAMAGRPSFAMGHSWAEFGPSAPRDIGSLVVPPDNNAECVVSGWDNDASSWPPVWRAPTAGDWDMHIRPDPCDDTQVRWPASSIATEPLRIEGNLLTSGEFLFASETQASSPATPGPVTILFGALVAGLVGWICRWGAR